MPAPSVVIADAVQRDLPGRPYARRGAPLDADRGHRLLVVKSTNHFHAAFAPLASRILYAAVDGPYPNEPRTTAYRHLTRALWPRVEHPHPSNRAWGASA